MEKNELVDKNFIGAEIDELSIEGLQLNTSVTPTHRKTIQVRVISGDGKSFLCLERSSNTLIVVPATKFSGARVTNHFSLNPT